MDLDLDPMDLMDLRLTGFGSRSNPSISYTEGNHDRYYEYPPNSIALPMPCAFDGVGS